MKKLLFYKFPNKYIESIFEVLLYIVMVVVVGIIYFIYVNKVDFPPSMLIALSALTASMAMTRSVYATKVSDEKNIALEAYKDRAKIYIDLMSCIDSARVGKELLLVLQEFNTIEMEINNKFKGHSIQTELYEIGKILRNLHKDSLRRKNPNKLAIKLSHQERMKNYNRIKNIASTITEKLQIFLDPENTYILTK
jgi:hypothetical protein